LLSYGFNHQKRSDNGKTKKIKEEGKVIVIQNIYTLSPSFASLGITKIRSA
jgi:hypothetical protein